MKRLIRLAVTAILSVIMMSCQKSETPTETPTQITIDPTLGTTPTITSTVEQGETTFGLTSITNWTIDVADQTKASAWVTVSPMSGGAGVHTITVKTLANNTGDSRSATIIISEDKVTTPVTINVTQKSSFSIMLASSGGLSAELAKIKGEITKLIISGAALNANDFIALQAETETILTVLDISQTATKAIPNNQFSGNKKITQVFLPEGLTTIGHNAFAWSGLTSVTIPSSIKTWQEDQSLQNTAFRLCYSLKEVTLAEGLMTIGSFAFFGSGLTSVTIPSSIKIWDESAFSACDSLKEVTLAEGLMIIGYRAFASSGLTSVTIPSSIKTWDKGDLGRVNHAFASCDALKEVTLTEGLTTIGPGAFQGTGLTSVTIPSSITDWQEGYMRHSAAFSSCDSLKEVTLAEGLTTIGRSAFWYSGVEIINSKSEIPPAIIHPELGYADEPFGNIYDDDNIAHITHIYVPTEAAVNAYKAADGWKTYINKISAK